MQDTASSRVTLLAFTVVSILIIIGIIVVIASRPEPIEITINPPVPTATAPSTATPAPILVYVTGAVVEPETTVQVPYGSRVQDALDAVGGTTEEADMSRVNLAAIIRDGDQVHVPKLLEDDDQDENADVLPTAPGGPVVYINTANINELQTLPNIGATIAERIIAYREANGPFTSLEQINEVSGIGDSTLEEIAPFISFE